MKRKSLKHGWRRFRRDETGATAVEFALVALPFFGLLYAILVTGLVFLAQGVLQTATTEASRLIMTGQAQSQNLNAAQFRQYVCSQVAALFDCSGIYVNVETFTSFSGVSRLNPLQNGNFNTGAMHYDSGGPGDIVLVQVFYQWPEYVGPMGYNLTNMNGNYRLMQATAVFRNEPY